jgi:hypothetical protein
LIGRKERKIAAASRLAILHDIRQLSPLMASKDIINGDGWSDVLARELEDTQFGIV